MSSKTAFAHMCAKRALIKSPRELGHVGLCIEFHKYDRALMSALGRLHRQLQVCLDDDQEERLSAGEARRLYLLHWLFCEGCAAHDAHNGLKWSVLNYCRDKDCLRSAYILHQSLRMGYSLLVKHCNTRIASKLAFRGWAIPDPSAFYSGLGVNEDLGIILGRVVLTRLALRSQHVRAISSC